MSVQKQFKKKITIRVRTVGTGIVENNVLNDEDRKVSVSSETDWPKTSWGDLSLLTDYHGRWRAEPY